MRTKTLVLAALTSLSAVGLMAQTSTNVYSLNAVGYINVTVQPGFNLIADQLWASGGNSLSNILLNTSGIYDGALVYTWNATANSGAGSFVEDIGDSQFGDANTGWVNSGTSVVLSPGVGAWFKNPNPTNMTLTFVGTVPQGTNTVNISTGFNLIASPVPQAGDLVTNLGLLNYNDGDSVFLFENGAYLSTYIVDKEFGDSGYQSQWSSGLGDPQVSVGQGFWYKATAPVAWTRVFSVNQ